MFRWLIKIPPYITNSQEIMRTLHTKFKTNIKFQIKGTNVRHCSINKVWTFALVIECAMNDASKLETDILKAMNKEKGKDQTDLLLKGVRCIPMNTRGIYDEEVSKRIFMENRRYNMRTKTGS